MTGPAAVLELEGVSKRYPGLVALHEVSLAIAPGEIFALLGPNGAGKTTLIGAVCGLVKKSTGRIRLFGRDLDEDPITPRYDVGLVPQEINFDPFFTVEESLQIQLGYYGRPRDDGRVAQVLAALKLTEKAKSSTRALSGGMKRRLLIAKALVHRPRLVFLDEPTAGVDVELRRDLWSYVRALREEGTTVVLTTHYLDEAEELADRVGILDQGRLILVEDKQALMRRLGERKLEVLLKGPLPQLPETAAVSGALLAPDGRTLSYVEQPGRPSCAQVLELLYRAQLSIEEVNIHRPRLEEVLLTVLRGGHRSGAP